MSLGCTASAMGGLGLGMWRWSKDELRRTTCCIRLVCGLAGQSSFDSPGLGLAFPLAEETDRAFTGELHALSFFGSMGFFFYRIRRISHNDPRRR
jgi:hypothetical protein